MPEDQKPDIELSPFAARFAKTLFTCFPEWRQYVVAPNLEWQYSDDLAVEVHSQLTPEHPLHIITHGNSIIVSWGYWHRHFDSFGRQRTEKQIIRSAMRMIKGVVSGRLIDAYFYSISGGITSYGLIKPQKMKRMIHVRSKDRFVKDRSVIFLSWTNGYEQYNLDSERPTTN